MPSPSTRRAWIEIFRGEVDFKAVEASPSTRRAGIEIIMLLRCLVLKLSPSTRRAWIEISFRQHRLCDNRVALHPEGVDRNRRCFKFGVTHIIRVALHPEGVDRNSPVKGTGGNAAKVALHPEGVDRNRSLTKPTASTFASPSTRRAWIEMHLFSDIDNIILSPSTRRAWIEIDL